MDYRSDETKFVQALVDGEAAAWREFRTRYARVIERSISSVTSQFSAVVGADDVHEIFAMVCFRLLDNDKKKLRAFDPTRGHSLRGWLGMVAVQATYDYLRRRRRQLGRELDASRELSTTAPSPDPYEDYWTGQRARIFKTLLDRFGSRDREFLGHYLQGRMPDEIARAMGISVATVYSKKHKIHAELSRLATAFELAA